MSRVAVINAVGLTQRHLSQMPECLRLLSRRQCVPVQPLLPAVTCTMQATYLTGRIPEEHGIVGNGWYDRTLAEIQFWKQSNHLVAGPKLWEKIRQDYPDYTTAKVFWWYNMYSSADFTLTPRPIYKADGGKVFDIYTHPSSLRPAVKESLGDFPFPQFWGPMAGLASSQWIAESAKWVEEKYFPNLNLVYLPHLDYDLQRYGPSSPDAQRAVAELDGLLADLIEYFQERSVKVAILSEYGLTDVKHPVHLNRIFRECGWIKVRDELGTEILDPGASDVFALADHQVAHIYLRDRSLAQQVMTVLASVPGVEHVLEGMYRSAAGLDHHRSGDIIAVADPQSWFTYYYWMDDARAPDFARTVDIHRKPGYDPVELFIDPQIKKPDAYVAKKLLQKKMGMRMLMDLIPLEAKYVRGSHGRVPDDRADWPVLIGDFPAIDGLDKIMATQVHHELLGLIKRGLSR
jgi:predicted AlkP superfamily pyrophosphatase or phosphodiesterase